MVSRISDRRRVEEEFINIVVVLVVQLEFKRGYSNEDKKGVSQNMGGDSVEINRFGRGITEVEEVQEGGKLQDRPAEGFNN